jgi:hypothetical protein
LPPHPEVKGSSQAIAAGTCGEKFQKKKSKKISQWNLASSLSIVVEQSPHQPRVEGSSPAPTAGTWREKMLTNQRENIAQKYFVLHLGKY